MVSFVYSKGEKASFDIFFDLLMSEKSSEIFKSPPKVCIYILALPLSLCSPSNDRKVHIEDVPIGEYVAQLILQSSHNLSINSSSVDMNIEVRLQKSVEFVPSYDWQPLKPWHTIPAGIITR